MKKLMIAASAALCATVGFSDVTSANVVGYQKVTIPAQQYTMIGVNFQAVAGGSLSIQDIFPDPLGQGITGSKTAKAAGTANADVFMYWDPTDKGKYVTLYVCNDTSKPDKYNKWCVQTINTSLTTEQQAYWGTRDTVVDKNLPAGQGMWLYRPVYATELQLTMSGAATVAQSGLQIPVRGNGGYTMFCTGFTTAFAPNPDVAGTGPAIDWLGISGFVGSKTAKAAGTAGADVLMYWDPTDKGKYVTLYVCNDTSKPDKYNKWCVQTINTSLTTEQQASWGTRDTVVSRTIPAGQAVWWMRPSSTDLVVTIPQPYSL